jgi:hypothetical protein
MTWLVYYTAMAIACVSPVVPVVMWLLRGRPGYAQLLATSIPIWVLSAFIFLVFERPVTMYGDMAGHPCQQQSHDGDGSFH